MKIRAVLLIALMIGGAYAMIQSYQEYEEKEFIEILAPKDAHFSSLIFTKPAMAGSESKSWIVDEPSEIESLLYFLQNYHVRKLVPEEIDPFDDIEQFSISLQDENGNTLSIIVTEDLIIQNSLLYYEIVDGPLNVDWLVQFFISNQT
jgi:hypothetical protein